MSEKEDGVVDVIMDCVSDFQSGQLTYNEFVNVLCERVYKRGYKDGADFTHDYIFGKLQESLENFKKLN